MTRIIFFIVSLLATFSVYGQPSEYDFSITYKPAVKAYWETYNSSLLTTENPKAIARHQQSLLRMCSLMEPFNGHLYELAWCYHMQKDYPNAVKYYYLAVAKGYIPYNQYTQPFFMLGNDSIPAYKTVLKQLDSLGKHPACAMDIRFCNLVVALHYGDQLSRSLDFANQDSVIKDKIGFRDRLYMFNDAQNLKQLLAYIDQYGIPHQNLMTDDAVSNFQILVHHLVQHSNNPEARRLFYLVRDAIANGRLPNKFLKMAIDYMYWPVKGQYFGSVSAKNKDGVYELNPPLIDPETADQRRAAWLFESLEQQMQYNYDTNYVLPKGYPSHRKEPH